MNWKVKKSTISVQVSVRVLGSDNREYSKHAGVCQFRGQIIANTISVQVSGRVLGSDNREYNKCAGLCENFRGQMRVTSCKCEQDVLTCRPWFSVLVKIETISIGDNCIVGSY